MDEKEYVRLFQVVIKNGKIFVARYVIEIISDEYIDIVESNTGEVGYRNKPELFNDIYSDNERSAVEKFLNENNAELLNIQNIFKQATLLLESLDSG